ncbi:MAG: hypothetical protein AAF420_07280 [Pseudomonadota bacterium]
MSHQTVWISAVISIGLSCFAAAAVANLIPSRGHLTEAASEPVSPILPRQTAFTPLRQPSVAEEAEALVSSEDLRSLNDISIVSEGFELEPVIRAQLVDDIASLYDLAHGLFNWLPDPYHTINVRLLVDRGQFLEEQMKAFGAVYSNTAYYRHKTREAVVYRQSEHQYTRQLVLHEVAHAILFDNVSGIPRWLNEGLAEYLSHATLKKNNVRYRQLAAQVRNAASPIELFEELLDKDGRDWRQASASLKSRYYSAAYLLVGFMSADDQRRDVLRNWLHGVHMEHYLRSRGVRQVLEDHSQISLQALAQQWSYWLHGH